MSLPSNDSTYIYVQHRNVAENCDIFSIALVGNKISTDMIVESDVVLLSGSVKIGQKTMKFEYTSYPYTCDGCVQCFR